jgi:hypothetical protein
MAHALNAELVGAAEAAPVVPMPPTAYVSGHAVVQDTPLFRSLRERKIAPKSLKEPVAQPVEQLTFNQ